MSSMFFARVRNRPQLMAILYMLVSTTGFSAMSVGVRLVSDELEPTLIVTLRNALTLLLLMPFVLHHRGALIRTKRLKSHAWRGCLGAVGMITWTYCLTVMPLSQATALSFTAPLLSTLFAILVLREKADRGRWLALFAGFCGALIIIRPGMVGFDWNALIVIFATTSWAITGMFVKSLSATEPPLRMVFYMNFFMLLMAAPFGAMHWQMPTLHGWLVLLAIACCSVVMHFSMAKAYSLAPVVTLMPLDFTRLISTAFFAYILFGETTDPIAWLGAGIIVICAVIMARRDVRKSAPVIEPDA